MDFLYVIEFRLEFSDMPLDPTTASLDTFLASRTKSNEIRNRTASQFYNASLAQLCPDWKPVF
jgi:hypothetical protein